MPHTYKVRLLLRLAQWPHKVVIIGYNIVSFRIEALLNAAIQTSRKNCQLTGKQVQPFYCVKNNFLLSYLTRFQSKLSCKNSEKKI